MLVAYKMRLLYTPMHGTIGFDPNLRESREGNT